MNLNTVARSSAKLSTFVRPGERIPLDGVLLEDRTQVDETMLTGEPLPVSRETGDALMSGAINGEGRIAQALVAGAAMALSSASVMASAWLLKKMAFPS